MSIGISAVGVPPASTEPEELLERIADIASELFEPFSGAARIAEDHALYALFPTAEEMTVGINAEGEIELEVTTTPVGAGYHARCCMLVDAIAERLGVEWREVTDDTEFHATRDEDELRAAFAGWARGVSDSLLGNEYEELSHLAVCMPVGERFHYPAFAITPFGPVSREELAERAASDEAAVAWMPWMEIVPSAETLLAAAKAIMWCDIRWREVDPDDAPDAEEPVHDAMVHALRLLETAHAVDPDLDYPWHEWLELLACAGEESEIAPTVDACANQTPEPESPIGYRRHDVTVSLPFGAAIRLPGDLTWMLTDDAWVAAGGSVAAYITPYTPGDEQAAPSAADLLERAWEDFMSDNENDRVGEPFEWADEESGSVGRGEHAVAPAQESEGEAEDDDDEGEPTLITQGIIARPDRFLFCTLTYREESQREWAEECLRSIQMAAGE